MADDAKKKILKDVLGELDKTNTAEPAIDEITGLDQKIPVINEGVINFEDDPELEDINIPIPEEDFSLEQDQENKVKIEEVEQEVDEKITDEFGKNELMEQKVLMLMEENKKQFAIIKKQKAELDEYTERLGALENENKKLKSEIGNADGNAKANVESQLNRATIIEEKYNNLAKQHEEMKARVRKDIRKIRVREKELANKLEMMKNDSETLLTAKDKKILQLKQHIDNLEFEIEALKERAQTLQEVARENEEKAERVIKALRLSTSLLETGGKK